MILLPVPSRSSSRLAIASAFALCLVAGAVPARGELFTHRLSPSNAAFDFWTTPPATRVFADSPLPAAVDSQVRVYAASHETEPFQVVVRPAASGPVTVSIGAFGAGITTELFQVKTVPVAMVSDNLGRTGNYPDPLWPLPLPATVDLVAGENTALWFSVRVPRSTPAGDYPTSVVIGGVSIPVTLHVFGFAIPDELHVRSEMTVDRGAIMTAYSVGDLFDYVERINRFFIEHRLTPSIPTWPGAVTSGGAPLLSYDCAGTLTDTDGVWGFEIPAAKYLDGVGFNGGTGFPSFAAASYRSTIAADDQRPTTFCGQTRTAADWVTGNNPGSPYNVEWLEWLATLRNYLSGLGYLGKGYYFIATEPLGASDYDAIAWHSQLIKSVAPELRLLVAEEPRPEIFAHPTWTGAKIDTWLALSNRFDPAVSWDREANASESTWLYFLGNTRTPRFNPITLDHPGLESLLTGWYFWKHRVRGLSHYSMNGWFPNPWTTPWSGTQNGENALLYPPSPANVPIPLGSNGHRFVPSIRLELMRDGLENYEYLHVLNGGPPLVGTTHPADSLATLVVGGLTAHTRNVDFVYDLRRQIGLHVGGELATFPDAVPPPEHPRALAPPTDFHINFQNPAGPPLADPLVVGGKTYQKIGWSPYSAAAGHGWIGDLSQASAGYNPAGPDELRRSYLYDDFGRIKVFEFDLPNGSWDVTLSVGRPGSTDLHNRVVIEGVTFVGDEATTPYLTRTFPVTVRDHKLTLEMGIDGEYTMLNFLDIEVPNPDVDADGMPGSWEALHACLDPGVADAGLDPDEDLLSSLAEYGAGTDPCDSDSDDGEDNDGSELANGRLPGNPGDDLALTIAATRDGATVRLSWGDGLGSNGDIDGPYFVYRSTPNPLDGSPVLVDGPIADGTVLSSDPSPPCPVCFYQVRNTRIP